MDNYTHAAIQIQGFRRKEKELNSLLQGFLAILKALGFKGVKEKPVLNSIQDQILSETPTET